MRLLLGAVIGVLSLVLVSCSFSPLDPKKPTPTYNLIADKSVVHGTLPNGLKYYIRANGFPENRVNLQLAVKAGSLADPVDKKGLAHFVEHMAFNGTKNYPKQQVITRMEEMGMRFGSHTNAYTSFSQTVYKLTAPTEESQDVSDALTILREWAGNISFESKEVADEIGVVVEEWRSRMLGKGARVGLQGFEITHQGSDYVQKLPIGEKAHVESFTQQDVISFYNTWYQPQNMALFIVGDINPSNIEQQLVSLFSDLKQGDSVAIELPDVPLVSGLHVHSISDQEIVSPYMQMLLLTEQKHITDPDLHFRHFVLNALMLDIVNRRLKQVADSELPMFARAQSGSSSLSDQRRMRTIGFVPLKGDLQSAFIGGYTEIVRLIKYGISQAEFDWAKNKLNKSLEQQLTRLEKTDHSYYLNKLLSSYFNGTVQFSREEAITRARLALSQATQKDVESYLAEEYSNPNRVLVSNLPDNFSKPIPTKLLVEQWIAKANVLATDQFDAQLVSELSYPFSTEGGAITSEHYLDKLDAFHWQLNNGIEVYFKSSDLAPDSVHLRAMSHGGFSLIDDELLKTSYVFSSIRGANGIAGLSPSQTSDYLRTKKVSMSFNVSDFGHGYTVSGTSRNLEDMLQLSNWSLLKPQFEAHVLDKFKIRAAEYQQKKYSQPNAKFSDEFRQFYYQNHFRAQPYNVDDVNRINNADLLGLHNVWYHNPAQFTYFLTGDIATEKAKELVIKYLGSLPSKSLPPVTWVDRQKRKRSGEHEFKRQILNEEKAHVKVNLFNVVDDYQLPVASKFYFVSKVGQYLLRQELREKLGATYGVSMRGSFSDVPINQQQLSIAFSTDPALVETTLKSVDVVLAKLAAGDFEDSILENEKEAWFKSQQTWKKRLGWWRMRLINYGFDGDPEDLFEKRETWVKQVTKADVQALTKNMLKANNKVTSVMLPKPQDN